MLSHFHLLTSYGFAATFLTGTIASLVGLRRPHLGRWAAWIFVASFVLLLAAYLPGFSLKSALLQQASETGQQVIQRHHDMAKFVLTGCSLITAASLTVLLKYRDQPLPSWFLPNLLFLALTVITFVVRSLVYAYRIAL